MMTVILTSVVMRSGAAGKDQDPYPQGVQVIKVPCEVILSPALPQSNFNTKGWVPDPKPKCSALTLFERTGQVCGLPDRLWPALGSLHLG